MIAIVEQQNFCADSDRELLRDPEAVTRTRVDVQSIFVFDV